MDNVARLDSSRRGELFAETADRLRLSDTVVEKDFWVCWTLQQIFSIDALKNTLLFKGGTSLSKIFRAINRFSEDIEIAVDYAALGFVGARDPRQEGMSRTRQNKILEEMLSACRLYIGNEFLPVLSERFQEVLGTGTGLSPSVPPILTLFSFDTRLRWPIAPTAERLPALRLDYRDMAAMIFGEAPQFDSLIRQLVLLEAEINRNAPGC